MRPRTNLLVQLLLYIILLSSALTSCRSLRHMGYENGHQYVDLGLSVNWATMNVGAVAPQDSGDTGQWGVRMEPCSGKNL
jgi:hypothetical protein